MLTKRTLYYRLDTRCRRAHNAYAEYCICKRFNSKYWRGKTTNIFTSVFKRNKEGTRRLLCTNRSIIKIPIYYSLLIDILKYGRVVAQGDAISISVQLATFKGNICLKLMRGKILFFCLVTKWLFFYQWTNTRQQFQILGNDILIRSFIQPSHCVQEVIVRLSMHL